MDLHEAVRVLGVEKATSLDDVRVAYKRAAIRYHPDKSMDPATGALFRRASEAFALLGEYHDRGGRFPVSVNVREVRVETPDAPTDSISSVLKPFIASAMQAIPTWVIGSFGATLGGIMGEMLTSGKVTRKGLRHIAEVLLDGLFDEVSVGEPVPDKDEVAGVLVVAPRAWARYRDEAKQMKAPAPVFGRIEADGAPSQVGLFSVARQRDGLVNIAGRWYRVVVQQLSAPL